MCVCVFRYWLWYTTHSCISGVVRKVYHRLKQFRVQFLVLQRKTDLVQVLLQCLPSDKVCVCVCNNLCIYMVMIFFVGSKTTKPSKMLFGHHAMRFLIFCHGYYGDVNKSARLNVQDERNSYTHDTQQKM